jgi:hypothetical protein
MAAGDTVMNRRDFLTASGLGIAAGLAGCHSQPAPSLPPGKLLGDSPKVGHLLWDAHFPQASETRRVSVAIVGAGIGGLSAGWKLAKSGFEDFLLLELEGEPGGNARSGGNAISACPLGAHYLPLPTQESTAVRELLSELGVLQGDPRAAKPRYDERYLCAAPQDRLYRNGLWQEGVLPLAGVSLKERKQYEHFHALMAEFRQRRDKQGRRAFAIPMELSSREPDLLALDQMTIRDWLLKQGLDSPHLHWYVDYACRDDYGTRAAEVSAWAGIHYFACRNGEAQDAAGDTVLTTAGGNGWLAAGLAARCQGKILTGTLAYRVSDSVGQVVVDCWLPGEKRGLRIAAEHLIWASQVFSLPHVLTSHEDLKQAAKAYSHAPWLVANLTLERPPYQHTGFPLAWDNVLFDSPGLGYVVDTHQRMRLANGPLVISYYRALAEGSPADGRQALLSLSRKAWAEQILSDLSRPHPDLRELVRELDVVRHGHAMARPLPGLIWGPARAAFAADGDRIRFAHADASGFSLFEEAQYRGVLAAERTMKRLGHSFASSLV